MMEFVNILHTEVDIKILTRGYSIIRLGCIKVGNIIVKLNGSKNTGVVKWFIMLVSKTNVTGSNPVTSAFKIGGLP